jgi:hypothetical protein
VSYKELLKGVLSASQAVKGTLNLPLNNSHLETQKVIIPPIIFSFDKLRKEF